MQEDNILTVREGRKEKEKEERKDGWKEENKEGIKGREGKKESKK